jgi:hypothetical protein
MQRSENKELIRRWIAFANTGFDGHFTEFITPDYIGHLEAAPPNTPRQPTSRARASGVLEAIPSAARG